MEIAHSKIEPDLKWLRKLWLLVHLALYSAFRLCQVILDILGLIGSAIAIGSYID